MSVSKELALDLYDKMVRTRLLEERMREFYAAGRIPGSLHLGLGHEALSVGATAMLRPDDYLVFSHRGVGHSIGKGVSERSILAEFMGKAGGCSLGKGGVHLADVAHGSLGISGSQGGNAVIATGAALAARYAHLDRVAVCFFGEGTANRGPVYEGINLAAVWRLPAIFVCENDFYSFSTPQDQVMLVADVAERAAGFGIPGATVDGNDPLAVYAAVATAVARARRGLGPSLVEGKTQRFCGHHERDRHTYRTAEEIAAARQACPIARFRARLSAEFGAGEAELAAIERRAGETIEEATRYAEQSPWPDPARLYSGVYA